MKPLSSVGRNPEGALRLFMPGVVLTVGLTCSLLATSTALADNIDDKLLRESPKMVQYVRDKGYKSVGVLTFMLKKGDQESRFQGALICGNMVDRLTNALALSLNSKEPEFQIVRDAPAVAGKTIPGASYRTARDRNQLFAVKYPLLWSDRSATVIPDAFLSGRVRISADMRVTNVAIGLFSRKDPAAMEDVLEFDVPTDAHILADVGEGFSLSKGRRSFLRGFSDDAVLESVKDDRKDNSEPASQASSPTKSGFPVTLTVLYDGEAQPLKGDSDSKGSSNFRAAEPREGQELTFGLRNETNETIGVVLTVNGVSTLHEQEQGQATEMQKWVLEPKQYYLVKGFHQKDHKTFITIRALSEKQSTERLADLGGEKWAGLIHLHVFRPVGKDAVAPAFTRSIGRLSVLDQANRHFDSLAELKELLAANSVLNPRNVRPLFGWGAEGSEKLQEKQLGDLRLTDEMIVRYYDLPATGSKK